MRILTAGATAAKNGRYIKADWLVESPASAVDFHWSYGFAGPPSTWKRRIRRLHEFEFSVQPGGGLSPVVSLIVESVEDGTSQSLRERWEDKEVMEGQALEGSLLFAGEAYTDRIQFFTGEIEKTEWSNGAGTLTAVDKTLPADVLLPTTLISLASFPNAPVESVNRPLPLLYGLGGQGRMEYAPLILVDQVTMRHYRAAAHALQSLSSLMAIWPPNSRQGRRLANVGAATVSATGAEVILTQPLTGTLLEELGGTAVALGRQVGVTNATALLDGNPNTFAIIGTATLNTDGDGYGELGIQATSLMPEGANVLRITLDKFRRSSGSLSTVTGRFRVRLLDTTGVVLLDNLWTSEQFRHVSQRRSEVAHIKPVAFTANHIVELLVDVRNEGGIGGTSDTFEIGGIGLTIGYQPDSPLEQLYLEGISGVQNFTGRSDPDGSITGTALSRVENRADVIRSLLRDEIGEFIDTPSFNDARSVLQGTYFDGGIGAGWAVERLSAAQLLHDLAQHAQGYIFPSGQNTYKMTVFQEPAYVEGGYVDPGYILEEITAETFTQSHVLVTNPDDQAPNWQSSLHIELSRMELVHNNFLVRYGWHPPTQQFSKQVFAHKDGSNHSTRASDMALYCAESFARYGTKPPYEVDAYLIQHQGTAEALLAHLVEYFSAQHLVVSFDTTLRACHLEPGDMVMFSHPELPTLENAQNYEVWRTRWIPSEGIIQLTCARALRRRLSYFQIKDQAGVIWYWWVNPARELTWTAVPPILPMRRSKDLALSPVPSWLQIVDDAAVTRYLYPTTIGETIVATVPPAIGTGYVGSPVLRGFPTGDWKIGISVAREPYITPA